MASKHHSIHEDNKIRMRQSPARDGLKTWRSQCQLTCNPIIRDEGLRMKGCMEVWRTIELQFWYCSNSLVGINWNWKRLEASWDGKCIYCPSSLTSARRGTGSNFNSANWLKGSDPGFSCRPRPGGPGQRRHAAGHLFELIEDSDSNSMRLTNMIWEYEIRSM